MQNYSDVFAQTLAEFESNYVPGDQGDAGKGQVTARAGYRINKTMNSNTGYIAKNPGQTQFHGISVDALLDRSDGSGADFLTDELQPDGRRLIKLAYSVYPTPPPGTPMPPSNWVQPTDTHLTYPGPMKLKDSAPVPGPEPEPTPPREEMPPMPTEWSSHEIGVMDWWTDMCPRLDAVYCNLFTADDATELRHADYGGWGNWVFHIRENGRSVDWVVREMKKSDEYHEAHPEG